METTTTTTASNEAPPVDVFDTYRSKLEHFDFIMMRNEIGGLPEAIALPLMKRARVHEGQFFVQDSDGAIVALKDAARSAQREFDAAKELKRKELEARLAPRSTLVPVDPQAAWFSLPRETRVFWSAASQSTNEVERALFLKIGKLFKNGGHSPLTPAILELVPELAR